MATPIRSVFGPAIPLLWRRKWHALRSGVIGSVVGMLPGAGADIGAWVSLAASKRTSKTPDEYGRGSLEGVGDATAANNSALAGAWVPALVFGIPGDFVLPLFRKFFFCDFSSELVVLGLGFIVLFLQRQQLLAT